MNKSNDDDDDDDGSGGGGGEMVTFPPCQQIVVTLWVEPIIQTNALHKPGRTHVQNLFLFSCIIL